MLSIIIPTLNEEKIIERTLKALRELSVIDFEIIVSDGASKDKTIDIARCYANHVVIHDGSHRQTIAEGKNLGATVATGDFLVFLDADVHIPDINLFFARALNLFATDSRLVGLTVFLKVLPERVTLSDKLFFGIVNRWYQFSNNVLHFGVASGEFQMIRKDAFFKLNGYNPKLVVGEDNDMFARLARLGHTRAEAGLAVWHTSRRAHNIGWGRLLWKWTSNFVYMKIFKRSPFTEWEPIR